MKVDQFSLLVQTGTIARVVLFGTSEGWEVRGYGEQGHELAPGIGNRVHTQRGAVRVWSSLDTAYKWLSSVGAIAPRCSVTIEGVAGEVDEQRGLVGGGGS